LPNILYRAKEASGADTAGFVEAPSAPAALEILKGRGYTAIELHESPDSAQRRGGRGGLSDEEAARLAAFELRLRRKPGLMTVLGEVARRNRVWIAVDCGLLVGGLATGRPAMALTGATLLVLTFGWPVWAHRHARNFNRMIIAMAIGEWDEAAALLGRLRGGQLAAAMANSMDFYEAQIRVRRGEPLAAVLNDIEKLRPRFAATPGHFDARLASVHSAGGDYAGFLACMRRSHQATPEDPSRQLDLALAEARLGEPDQAAAVFASVNQEALPAHGRPYIDWTGGLIALRRGDHAQAQASLLEGVSGFLKTPSPAALSSLALCSGACALALARNGQVPAARKMIEQVARILPVYADPLLRAEIKREIGVAV
jgi:tetratricopeptide (TPR) repeat protein